jgi:hypothetical protein
MSQTPGPWYLNFGSESPHCVISDKPLLMLPGDAPDTLVIATVYSTDTRMRPEPNARLIAAAPDMLDILKMTAQRYDRGDFEETAYRQILDVIAKAEGCSE